MNIKPVDSMKMLSLVSLLSKYDLFHISTNDGDEFNATQIINRKSGTIEFKRLFAIPVFSDDIITDIQANADNEFICRTPDKTYKIRALHSKPQESIIRKQKKWEDIFDLMDISFFSKRFTTYSKKMNMLTFAVDPYLLGELSPVEYSQIKNIINVYLGGLSKSMQMSRTVCFQVKKDENNRIYAGVYDLEGCCAITSNLIYDDRDRNIIPENVDQKAQCILKYAEAIWKNFS